MAIYNIHIYSYRLKNIVTSGTVGNRLGFYGTEHCCNPSSLFAGVVFLTDGARDLFCSAPSCSSAHTMLIPLLCSVRYGSRELRITSHSSTETSSGTFVGTNLSLTWERFLVQSEALIMQSWGMKKDYMLHGRKDTAKN
ncbi:hypothetical protein AAHE18_02G063000 [Arachis hypogaea]